MTFANDPRQVAQNLADLWPSLLDNEPPSPQDYVLFMRRQARGLISPGQAPDVDAFSNDPPTHLLAAQVLGDYLAAKEGRSIGGNAGNLSDAFGASARMIGDDDAAAGEGFGAVPPDQTHRLPISAATAAVKAEAPVGQTPAVQTAIQVAPWQPVTLDPPVQLQETSATALDPLGGMTVDGKGNGWSGAAGAVSSGGIPPQGPNLAPSPYSAEASWRPGTTSNGSPPDSPGSLTLERGGGVTLTGAKRKLNPSSFPEFYSGWAKQYKHAPPLVSANNWKPITPDASKMTPESAVGPYRMITLHHTGSESTPESVDRFDRGQEDPIHLFKREIVNLGNAPIHNDGDVTYHFLVGRNGTIYEGRSLDYEGAHVYGQNAGNVGVAFLGDYSSSPLTDAQVRAVKTLVHALNDAYHISQTAGGKRYIFTHRELAPAKGPHARPTELLGADRQIDEIKNWSKSTIPRGH